MINPVIGDRNGKRQYSKLHLESTEYQIDLRLYGDWIMNDKGLSCRK